MLCLKEQARARRWLPVAAAVAFMSCQPVPVTGDFATKHNPAASRVLATTGFAAAAFWRSQGFKLDDWQLVYVANFDDGTLGHANPNQFCCAHSYAFDSKTVRDGEYSLRLLLKRSDPNVARGRRAEINDASQRIWSESDREYLYSTSVYIPDDFNFDDANAPDIVLQWWAKPDREDYPGRSPPLHIAIVENKWSIKLRWDSRPRTPSAHPRWEGMLERFTSLRKGRWTDWHVYAKWGHDNSGIIKIWKNSKLVFSRVGAPNTYNDRIGVAAKAGIYKWPWQRGLGKPDIGQRKIYIDEHYTWVRSRNDPIGDGSR